MTDFQREARKDCHQSELHDHESLVLNLDDQVGLREQPTVFGCRTPCALP